MSGLIFDYTTGNPDNLIGGDDASMDDIQGPFYDIRAFLNSGVLDEVAKSLLIVGEVRFIAVPSAPLLWLVCDGTPVSRSTYAKLFAAVGTIYGAGDGVNTFNVPDLRGRVPVGTGVGGTGSDGAALAARAAGAKFGEENHALATTELAAHNHAHTLGTSGVGTHDHTGTTQGNNVSLDHKHFPDAGGTGIPTYPLGGVGPTSIGSPTVANLVGSVGFNDRSLTHVHAIVGDGAHSHGISGGINNAGGGAGHNNVQPSLAVPAYIYAAA